MRVSVLIAQAKHILKQAGIGSADLDSLILLEDISHKSRAFLLAHPEFELDQTQIKRFRHQLHRRTKHEPLAYIRGFSEFYGRRFNVNRHVLEPRPESETMIELLLKLPLLAKPTIADVGTGSGCLGVTTALEIHGAQVDLYDIDSYALAVAKHNADMHELHLHAYKRDLLAKPARAYDAILANLPYVPNHWRINQAAAMEPKLAIFGGPDGLDLYRRLFENIYKIPSKPTFVLTESLPPQHKLLAKIASDKGYDLYQNQDFIQVFRLS